jgi:hypothetical protein
LGEEEKEVIESEWSKLIPSQEGRL